MTPLLDRTRPTTSVEGRRTRPAVDPKLFARALGVAWVAGYVAIDLLYPAVDPAAELVFSGWVIVAFTAMFAMFSAVLFGLAGRARIAAVSGVVAGVFGVLPGASCVALGHEALPMWAIGQIVIWSALALVSAGVFFLVRRV